MPVQKVTKEEILLKALEVFRTQGYHHTSMSDLAAGCGLLKGSFYHHFDGKEALMREVLLWIRTYLNEKVFALAYADGLSGQQKLGNLIRKLSKLLLSTQGGCVLGNMTLETARLIPEFQRILKEIFTDWAQALTHIFQEKYDVEGAKKLAWQTIMEYEGAVMVNKLFDDPQIYQDCYARALARMSA